MNQVATTESISTDFADFIAAARDDASMKEQLSWVLSFDSIERRLLIGTLLGRLSRGNAPEHLVSALRLLLDDDVATTALELLEQPVAIH